MLDESELTQNLTTGSEHGSVEQGTASTTTAWCVLFGLLAVAISLSNAITIATFCSKTLKRKTAHYFLINLAISDLMVGMVAVPIYIYMLKSANFLQDVRFLFRFFDIVSGLASLFSITAISLERFYAIKWPLSYRIVGKRCYAIAIISTWIGACSAGVFNVLSFQGTMPTFGLSAHMAFTCVTLVIPVCVTTASYIATWVKKRKSRSRVQGFIQEEGKREKAFTRTLMVVTIVFFLTWLPFIILNAIPYQYIQLSSYDVIFILKFLHYGNSFANPLIYTLRIPEFRHTARDIACRKKSLRHVVVNTTNFTTSSNTVDGVNQAQMDLKAVHCQFDPGQIEINMKHNNSAFIVTNYFQVI